MYRMIALHGYQYMRIIKDGCTGLPNKKEKRASMHIALIRII